MVSGPGSFRRTVSLVLILLHVPLATSCSAWKTQVKPVREVIESDPSASMRIHCRAKEPLVIRGVQVRGDSLGWMSEQVVSVPVPGDWRGPATKRWVSPLRPVGIPIDSIQEIELRQFSAKKTAMNTGFWLGVLAVAAVVVYAATDPGRYGFR